MAKTLRYGRKDYKPVRTLATTTPRTLATKGLETLTTRGEKTLFPGEKARRSSGGQLHTYDSAGRPIQQRGEGKDSGKKGKVPSGGTYASRTDADEEGGGNESYTPKKPKGVVRADVVVRLLGEMGMDQASAESLVLKYQLSQSNPRVKTTGPVDRRAGGAGYGRGGSRPASSKRTKQPAAAALPAPPSRPALPAPPSRPALPAPPSKSSGFLAQQTAATKATADEIAKVPDSVLKMQAMGIIRSVEDVVRTIFEPVEKSAKKAQRAERVIKTALAEGEIGKAIDALAANAIEFEDEADKAQTYSWLERMIRKIQ